MIGVVLPGSGDSCPADSCPADSGDVDPGPLVPTAATGKSLVPGSVPGVCPVCFFGVLAGSSAPDISLRPTSACRLSLVGNIVQLTSSSLQVFFSVLFLNKNTE